MQGGHQHHACGFRLIVEPVPRGGKDEDEDEADSDIVLPRGSGEVPKDQPLPETTSRDCLSVCSLRHYSECNIEKLSAVLPQGFSSVRTTRASKWPVSSTSA